MNGYDLINFLSSLFTGYTLYLLMGVFFNRRQTNSSVIFLSFLVYCVFIHTLYIVMPVPVILLIFNIIGIFILTYNYKSNLKVRLISAVYMYTILMILETIVAIFYGYLGSSIINIEPEYSSVAGLITIRLLTFFIILIIRNLQFIRTCNSLPPAYGFSAFVIPAGTLYIMLLLLQQADIDILMIAFASTVIFLINIASINMYNGIIEFINYTNNIIMYQKKEYRKQELEILKDSLIKMRKVNHDINNHLSMISIYLEKGRINTAKDYIDQVANVYNKKIHYIYSKNIDIDSIINYKIGQAEQNHLILECKVNIPKEIGISIYDLNIILSNLLDNAMNASKKLKKNRKIYFTMIYRLGIIFISVINYYNGEVKLENGKLLTLNKDDALHGYGLINITETVNKYNGKVVIGYNTNEFKVDVMLYAT